jgi:hypothetical protein
MGARAHCRSCESRVNCLEAAKPIKKLWQCETFAEQVDWCRLRLLEGHTLTDPAIWLGGAEPDSVIRALRKEGLAIETIRVKTVDAAGEVHPKTLAWRCQKIAAPPPSTVQ